DERSFRIMLVADRYVNPPPDGLDAVAVAAQTGWGVMQLPADDYPPEVAGPLLAEGAEPKGGVSRDGSGFVVVGERAALAGAPAWPRRWRRSASRSRAASARRRPPSWLSFSTAAPPPAQAGTPARPSADARRSGRASGRSGNAALQPPRDQVEPRGVRLHAPE